MKLVHALVVGTAASSLLAAGLVVACPYAKKQAATTAQAEAPAQVESVQVQKVGSTKDGGCHGMKAKVAQAGVAQAGASKGGCDKSKKASVAQAGYAKGGCDKAKKASVAQAGASKGGCDKSMKTVGVAKAGSGCCAKGKTASVAKAGAGCCAKKDAAKAGQVAAAGGCHGKTKPAVAQAGASQETSVRLTALSGCNPGQMHSSYSTKSVKIRGTLACGHCDLKLTDGCATVIQTAEGCNVRVVGPRAEQLKGHEGVRTQVVQVHGKVTDDGAVKLNRYRLVGPIVTAPVGL